MTLPRSPAASEELAALIQSVVAATPVTDIHTHLYDPAFGDLLRWGIDDLLVYHYLVAEAFRHFALPHEDFFALPKTEQAGLIWDALFVEHSPLSEACRGVLTTLHRLGLDVRHRDLPTLRRWFAEQRPGEFITRCLALANVRSVCMTNSPFDAAERAVWERGFARDERFTAALRIDPLLLAWPEAELQLAGWGYAVGAGLSTSTFDGVRRFLADWTKRIAPRYLMVSVPPEFAFPDDGPCAQLLEHAVLPHCREHGLPFALMLGVRRAVNPRLQMAGDGVARSNLTALENLCARFPENRFLATVLSLENQHELCVVARKFGNLHPFGCWWFTNIPQVMESMTRQRLELLGPSFTVQHSDARVIDQLIYKWDHTRQILTRVLTDKYADLAATGWTVPRADLERDARALLGGAFDQFCGG